MRQEVKEYLLSIGDRSLGLEYGRERAQYGPLDRAMAIVGQTMLPITTEVINAGLSYTDRSEFQKISTGRAIAYGGLGVAIALGAGGIDITADAMALMVGIANPAEGVLLKGTINVGSHVLLDAIKYAVHHPPSFR